MKKLEIATLNLDEVLQKNRETVKEALRLAGGRILFITEEEFDNEELSVTSKNDLEAFLFDSYGVLESCYLCGVSLRGDATELIVSRCDGGCTEEELDTFYAEPYDLVYCGYDENRIWEKVISKYNESIS